MSNAETKTDRIEEKYQIFVPLRAARWGGSQTLTLRSGDTIQFHIPSRLQENSQLTVKGVGLQGNDITVICHALYDTTERIGDKIYTEIDETKFVMDEMTKDRCKGIYESLEDGKFVGDLTGLDLLDYVVASSKLDEKIRDRYSIASNNSRLTGIENAIAAGLEKSQLDEERQKLIKGTYARVRDVEPVPDFTALTDCNAIVVASDLSEGLKQTYLMASAKSKALTVDFLIVEAIEGKLDGTQKEEYLSVYQKVRDGEKISEEEEETLKSLDAFIENSEVSETSKTLYLVARVLGEKAETQKDPLLEAIEQSNKLTSEEKNMYALARSLAMKGEADEQAEKEVIEYAVAKFHGELSEADGKAEEKEFAGYARLVAARLLEWFINKAEVPKTYKYAGAALVGYVAEGKEFDGLQAAAAALVPAATSALKALGTEAGTGLAIGTLLNGAAATTASLAAAGSASVTAGGLGMLGGLAVVTGGAALIGAAGLLSVALLTQMDRGDYLNLGIAGTMGVLTSATVALAVWTGAGALGVAGSLTGAAAISSTIAALGGLGVMTGGAALVALGTGFAVWSVLKGKKSRQDMLKEFECRSYTLTEPSGEPAVSFILANFPNGENAYLAPEIPADKLANALSKYGDIGVGEKVLGLIDTSGFHDAKDGILFSDRQLIWRPAYSSSESAGYSELDDGKIGEVSEKMLEGEGDKAKFASFLRGLKEVMQK